MNPVPPGSGTYGLYAVWIGPIDLPHAQDTACFSHLKQSGANAPPTWEAYFMRYPYQPSPAHWLLCAGLVYGPNPDQPHVLELACTGMAPYAVSALDWPTCSMFRVQPHALHVACTSPGPVIELHAVHGAGTVWAAYGCTGPHLHTRSSTQGRSMGQIQPQNQHTGSVQYGCCLKQVPYASPMCHSMQTQGQ